MKKNIDEEKMADEIISKYKKAINIDDVPDKSEIEERASRLYYKYRQKQAAESLTGNNKIIDKLQNIYKKYVVRYSLVLYPALVIIISAGVFLIISHINNQPEIITKGNPVEQINELKEKKVEIAADKSAPKNVTTPEATVEQIDIIKINTNTLSPTDDTKLTGDSSEKDNKIIEFIKNYFESKNIKIIKINNNQLETAFLSSPDVNMPYSLRFNISFANKEIKIDKINETVDANYTKGIKNWNEFYRKFRDSLEGFCMLLE